MSFIQVDKEFVVEADITGNNTGEDIMVETGENIVPLSNSNKRSLTLVDTEDNSAGEDYFSILKNFRPAARSKNMNGVFRRICFLMF